MFEDLLRRAALWAG